MSLWISSDQLDMTKWLCFKEWVWPDILWSWGSLYMFCMCLLCGLDWGAEAIQVFLWSYQSCKGHKPNCTDIFATCWHFTGHSKSQGWIQSKAMGKHTPSTLWEGHENYIRKDIDKGIRNRGQLADLLQAVKPQNTAHHCLIPTLTIVWQ